MPQLRSSVALANEKPRVAGALCAPLPEAEAMPPLCGSDAACAAISLAVKTFPPEGAWLAPLLGELDGEFDGVGGDSDYAEAGGEA